MSGVDLQKLLEQAQAVQRRMAEAQAGLAAKTVDAESGGGLVRVTANGRGEIVRLHLDPQCVDARDVRMLEDLVVAATNKALGEARALAERELGALAGGMLPGLGGLF
jgi:hypothetical protein